MTRTNTPYSVQELRQRMAPLPRISLAHLPTPLEHLTRFSEVLGGPRIWIKRDDCTGLAFGGNKVRHNEFLMADARKQGANTVVTVGGVQSNHCRQTAAAAARLGMKCEVILPHLSRFESSTYETSRPSINSSRTNSLKLWFSVPRKLEASTPTTPIRPNSRTTT